MYKGIVFAFGANSTVRCLEHLRKGNSREFDDVEEIEPIDGCSIYRHFGDDGNLIYEANLRPIECKRGDKKILLCPTRATVLNEEAGSARRRIKGYLGQQTEKAIGIGYVGSNRKDYTTGDFVLPSVGVCSGILLEQLPDEDHFASGIADRDLTDEIKFLFHEDRIKYNHGCAIMSVADYQDSVRRTADDMLNIGFAGRDMETAWFLGYSGKIKNPAASILVVSDFAGDGKLKDPRKSKPLELSRKAEDSMEMALKTAVEALFL